MKKKKTSTLRIDSGIKIAPSQSTLTQADGITAAAVVGSVLLVVIAAAAMFGSVFSYISMMSVSLNQTAIAIVAAA